MDPDTKQQIADAYAILPKVLQEAITDADVQAKLRKLSEIHKLHLDKWGLLEDEIMKGLLGITDINALAENIRREVGIDISQAIEIANAVSKIVFDPIRDELQEAIGTSKSTLEGIDHQAAKQEIDIGKFSPAHSDPLEYSPKATKKYVANNDPYQESVG